MVHELSGYDTLQYLGQEGQVCDGRQELRSPGLREGFLRRALTKARFCESGNTPDWSEALQIAATTGASTPAGLAIIIYEWCMDWI